MGINLGKEELLEDIVQEDVVQEDIEVSNQKFTEENKTSASVYIEKSNIEKLNIEKTNTKELKVEEPIKPVEHIQDVVSTKSSKTKESSEFLKLDKPKNLKIPKHLKKSNKKEKPTSLGKVIFRLIIVSVVCLIMVNACKDKTTSNEVNETANNKVTQQETAEANAKQMPALKVPDLTEVKIPEEPKVQEQSEVKEEPGLTEVVKEEQLYDAPQEGVIIKKGDIQIDNSGAEWSDEKDSTIVFYATLTNLTDTYAYSNVGIKLTLYNEDKVVLTQAYNVLTDTILEPHESKQFEVESRVKGTITNRRIEVLTADIVKVYEKVE